MVTPAIAPPVAVERTAILGSNIFLILLCLFWLTTRSASPSCPLFTIRVYPLDPYTFNTKSKQNYKFIKHSIRRLSHQLSAIFRLPQTLQVADNDADAQRRFEAITREMSYTDAANAQTREAMAFIQQARRKQSDARARRNR